jgi:hypothetical protein
VANKRRSRASVDAEAIVEPIVPLVDASDKFAAEVVAADDNAARGSHEWVEADASGAAEAKSSAAARTTSRT